MADTQEQVTALHGAVESVEGTAGAVGDKTTGAVGLLVRMLTGGLVIAGVAGFVAGFAAGVVVGRRSTPPPARWQVWR